MTMIEAKEIYKQNGGHFFNKDTMRFWGSKTETELYKNRCFVTSDDNFDRTKKLYTIRQFSEDYKHVETVGEFQAYETKSAAVEALQDITA